MANKTKEWVNDEANKDRKCPLCDGSGVDPTPHVTSGETSSCRMCKGQKKCSYFSEFTDEPGQIIYRMQMQGGALVTHSLSSKKIVEQFLDIMDDDSNFPTFDNKLKEISKRKHKS